MAISAAPAADEAWQTLADAHGLRVCAALFPAGSAGPGHWIYPAMRLVMVAGTTALNRGPASGGQDALLHALLAETPAARRPGRHQGRQQTMDPRLAMQVHTNLSQVRSASSSAKPTLGRISDIARQTRISHLHQQQAEAG